jgi:hypothetical protein
MSVHGPQRTHQLAAGAAAFGGKADADQLSPIESQFISTRPNRAIFQLAVISRTSLAFAVQAASRKPRSVPVET